MCKIDPDDEEELVFEDESDYKYNDGRVFEDVPNDDELVFGDEDEEDF
jgi:hypothetical protein